MDLGHLLRWKRKWAIIHNTAPLKTSIRWSLLSLLLIALEQAAPLGGYSSLSLYTQIYIKDLSVYQLLPLRIHIQPLVEVAWAPVTFPPSLMPDHASPLSLSLCVSDMGELLLSREGYTSYLSVPQDLKVHPGDNVVLTCSASSSEEPSYSWLKEVRELLERAQQHCPHYTFQKVVFPSQTFSPSTSDVTSFSFSYCLPSSSSRSRSLLALFKYSLNFLTSFNTSPFPSLTPSNHLFPLSCPLSVPLHRRSALYLSDQLA